MLIDHALIFKRLGDSDPTYIHVGVDDCLANFDLTKNSFDDI